MTEHNKRFGVSYDDRLIQYVKDIETGNNLSMIDCCIMLNDLSDENGKLRKYIHELSCYIARLGGWND